MYGLKMRNSSVTGFLLTYSHHSGYSNLAESRSLASGSFHADFVAVFIAAETIEHRGRVEATRNSSQKSFGGGGGGGGGGGRGGGDNAKKCLVLNIAYEMFF